MKNIKNHSCLRKVDAGRRRFRSQPNTFERKVRRGFAKVAEVFLDEFFCDFCVIFATFAFKKTSRTIAACACLATIPGLFI
ncbi:hypothetical protein [Ottowia testudinis]|uniref:Uncharacterized protein n=1 Tax=Ottowia testudinis TaxID=2816950 RepID=A0A975CL50_9BURK|nr:hypothetical protein [Ottowia testudinis]QTD47081.1 hypothetical protein J1M35_09555 [Ottowia testudinis]